MAEEIHKAHSGRWVSVQMHQSIVQLDDEIIAPDIFVRFVGDKTMKEKFE